MYAQKNVTTKKRSKDPCLLKDNMFVSDVRHASFSFRYVLRYHNRRRFGSGFNTRFSFLYTLLNKICHENINNLQKIPSCLYFCFVVCTVSFSVSLNKTVCYFLGKFSNSLQVGIRTSGLQKPHVIRGVQPCKTSGSLIAKVAKVVRLQIWCVC